MHSHREALRIVGQWPEGDVVVENFVTAKLIGTHNLVFVAQNDGAMRLPMNFFALAVKSQAIALRFIVSLRLVCVT